MFRKIADSETECILEAVDVGDFTAFLQCIKEFHVLLCIVLLKNGIVFTFV